MDQSSLSVGCLAASLTLSETPSCPSIGSLTRAAVFPGEDGWYCVTDGIA